MPKEGTVEPLPNGKRLPTDFNEGAKNNTYSRNEKMVGYSFDHEFNDTFTVRQNLRFAENKTFAKQRLWLRRLLRSGECLQQTVCGISASG